MAKYDSVKEQVAAIYRKHLDDKFGDQIAFDEIRVVPRLDHWGDEYLQIYMVFDGDGDLLDPHWMNGFYWELRPELLALGVISIPTDSYIDKAEIAPWTDEERARIFR